MNDQPSSISPERLAKLRKEEALNRVNREIDKLIADYAKTELEAIRAVNMAKMADIDNAMKYSKIREAKAVTKQVENDRLSLHDFAQNNDVLRRVLRKM